MLKHLFLFLGSLIIGFGLGLITGKYFALSSSSLWLLIIISLIGGGFLLALSLRHTTKVTETEEAPSFTPQNVQNH